MEKKEERWRACWDRCPLASASRIPSLPLASSMASRFTTNAHCPFPIWQSCLSLQGALSAHPLSPLLWRWPHLRRPPPPRFANWVVYSFRGIGYANFSAFVSIGIWYLNFEFRSRRLATRRVLRTPSRSLGFIRSQFLFLWLKILKIFCWRY